MTAFCRIVRKFAAELFKQDILMKKLVRALCVLLAASTVLTACLNNDNDNSMSGYSDMAITAMTLGTLNRYVESVSSTTGNDTVIKSTITGSSYPLSIDHLKGLIYNLNELPVGTDLSHVVFTASTKNGGIIGIKSLTSDTVRIHASTDSVDFSVPRTLRVFAANGMGYRDYTVNLTVSETVGIKFEWRKVIDSPLLADWPEETRLVILRDTVYPTLDQVVVKDTVAYMVDNGKLLCSENMENWETVASNTTLRSIFAAGTKELFALDNGGNVIHSEDDGETWSQEQLDADDLIFPLEGLVSATWNYRTSDSTDYVLVVGIHPLYADEMVVWRKISQYGGIGKGGYWAYMPFDPDNPFLLPCYEHLSLAYYNNKVLAVGKETKILESRDQGITWKTSADYTLPKALTGTAIRMAANDNTGIWLLTNTGQVWHGMKR